MVETNTKLMNFKTKLDLEDWAYLNPDTKKVIDNKIQEIKDFIEKNKDLTGLSEEDKSNLFSQVLGIIGQPEKSLYMELKDAAVDATYRLVFSLDEYLFLQKYLKTEYKYEYDDVTSYLYVLNDLENCKGKPIEATYEHLIHYSVVVAKINGRGKTPGTLHFANIRYMLETIGLVRKEIEELLKSIHFSIGLWNKEIEVKNPDPQDVIVNQQVTNSPVTEVVQAEAVQEK